MYQARASIAENTFNTQLMQVKISLPVIFTLLLAGCLLLAGNVSKKLGFVVTGNKYLNGQFNFQICLLALTLISLLVTWLQNKPDFINYFSFGKIAAEAKELKIFGIKKGDSWIKTGISLCVVISTATAAFMYFQLRQIKPDWSILSGNMIWIVLFSLSNSFGEEMIFRIGVVSPLRGLLEPATICFISAVLFGLPHFKGMPDGITGSLMAGVLGFVLAKSVVETNGFFWAWLIHFLQDIIIIGALLLMNSPRH